MKQINFLPTLAILFFIFLYNNANCQSVINKKYFSDQTSRQGAEALDMIVHKGFRIIASNEFGRGNNISSSFDINAGIYVFDSSFNIIWSVSDTNFHLGAIKLLTIDSNLYVCQAPSTYSFGLVKKYNLYTGSLLWTDTSEVFPFSLFERNSQSIGIFYNKSISGINSIWIKEINKSNGASTKNLALYTGLGPVNFDKEQAVYFNNNFYFTFGDSLFKVLADTPSKFSWRKEIKIADSLVNTGVLAIAPNNTLAVFGKNRTGSQVDAVVLYNLISGAKFKLINCNSIAGLPKLIKIINNDIYAGYSPPYNSQGTYLTITKFNTITKTKSWETNLSMTTNGFGVSTPASLNYISSITADTSGNLYITGNVKGPNSSNSMSIGKISIATGITNYYKTIDETPPGLDGGSKASNIYFINNELIVLGSLQLDYFEFYKGEFAIRPVIIKVNIANGLPLKIMNFAKSYKQEANAIKMVKTTSGFLSLQQEGRNLYLEHYSNNGSSLWRKRIFNRDYFLKGANLVLGSNDSIYVITTKHGLTSTPPFYNTNYPDSMIIFCFNLQGNQGRIHKLLVPSGLPTYMQIFADANSTIFLYSSFVLPFDDVYAVKLLPSGVFSAPVFLCKLSTSSIYGFVKWRNFQERNNSIAFWSNSFSSAPNKLMEINKSSMTVTTKATYPSSLGNILQIEFLDSNTLFMGGIKSGSDVLIKYDYLLNDTVFVKAVISGSGGILALTIDKVNNKIYACGYRNSTNNGTTPINRAYVAKIDANSGNIDWFNTYVKGSIFPILKEICFNDFTGNLAISGTTYNTPNPPFILMYDGNTGTLNDSFIFTNSSNFPCPTFIQGSTDFGILAGGSCKDTSIQGSMGYIFDLFSNSPQLPVNLLNFEAQKHELGNRLYWTTASEENNLGFEIERKAKTDFSKIGFVKGLGNTRNLANYHFTDTFSKANCESYSYRLKQLDFDGKFSYSKVVFISACEQEDGENLSLSCSPNPSSNHMIVNLIGTQSQENIISIFNSIGLKMFEFTIQNNNSSDIEISHLPNGLYSMVLKDEFSKKSCSTKFIKN